VRGKGTKLGEDPENIPKIFWDCYVRDNYVVPRVEGAEYELKFQNSNLKSY
jgi:hypothetical protein